MTTTEKFAVRRLLGPIAPSRYQVTKRVNLTTFVVDASEVISFDLTEDSETLTFHALGLDIYPTSVMLWKGPAFESLEYDTTLGTVTFKFAGPVPAGANTLQFRFRGQVEASLHGFYRVGYKTADGEGFLATSQMEGIHARQSFVCIDEPAAKAVIELTLVVAEDMVALSNTEPSRITNLGDGTKRVDFEPTPLMSTYLLYEGVGPFKFIEGLTDRGVVVRVHGLDWQMPQLGYALETAIKGLDYFEGLFGIPYPLAVLKLIVVEEFAAGAMENWGAMTFRDTAIMLHPEEASLAAKIRVTEVIFHEQVHQWFGDLVTMRWWNDLWLNESFATFVANVGMDALFPEWNVWQLFQEDYERAKHHDRRNATHPIEVEVLNPAELDGIFDAISYSKGGSVLRQLYEYLGHARFFAGVHLYLKSHAYGNAETVHLWAALSEASDLPVGEIMSAWTSQSGFPVISFHREADGTMWATQRRHFAAPDDPAAAGNDQLWPIPLSFLLPGGRSTETVMFDDYTMEVPSEVAEADWFVPNPGRSGFYRVAYTTEMIEALRDALTGDELSELDRQGIVCDVTATAEAGHTTAATLLRLAKVLREERSLVVWEAVSGALGSLLSVTEDEALRDRLERFGLWLVQPNLHRLGWDAPEGETPFDTLMRPMVLGQAIRFGDEETIAEAMRRFGDWIAGGDIDPNIRNAALSAASRYGGIGEYNAMVARYGTSDVPQVKMGLLAAMGGFRVRELNEAYLAWALTDAVRAQNAIYVLAAIFRNRTARDRAWEWMTSNWALWLERYGGGGHMLEYFPQFAAGAFCTLHMARVVQEFFDSHDHPSIRKTTREAVEELVISAGWGHRVFEELAAA